MSFIFETDTIRRYGHQRRVGSLRGASVRCRRPPWRLFACRRAHFGSNLFDNGLGFDLK